MELWDLYDINHRPTGETVARGEQIPAGRYHPVILVCIFNSKGEMLIQHSQSFKEGWSGLWDVTVGGSAVSGESSRQAAEREVREEIGYPLDLTGVAPAMCITFPDCFDEYYLVEREIDLSTLMLQYEEVQDAKWATMEEILSLIQNNMFLPYHTSFIEFLFFRRTYPGTRWDS